MNDTAVISPEVMECEDEVLKIHGRSNLNGANNRTGIPSNKMKGQANKNAFLLSSNVPSAINRLCTISRTGVTRRWHSEREVLAIMQRRCPLTAEHMNAYCSVC
jgi:hypothetical protein